MSNLGKVFIKYLGDKVKPKLIVESFDFFQMIINMGIADDSDSVYDIMEHLDENNIDINFREGETDNHRRFKMMKQQLRLIKELKIKRKRSAELMKKLEEIKIEPKLEWLQEYRYSGFEDEITDDGVVKPFVNPELDELNKRIQNKIKEKMTEQLNQMTDDERFEHAVNLLTETNNLLNNNQ